jgi:hypothetical protein
VTVKRGWGGGLGHPARKRRGDGRCCAHRRSRGLRLRLLAVVVTGGESQLIGSRCRTGAAVTVAGWSVRCTCSLWRLDDDLGVRRSRLTRTAGKMHVGRDKGRRTACRILRQGRPRPQL